MSEEAKEVIAKLRSLMGYSVSHGGIGLDAIVSAIALIERQEVVVDMVALRQLIADDKDKEVVVNLSLLRSECAWGDVPFGATKAVVIQDGLALIHRLVKDLLTLFEERMHEPKAMTEDEVVIGLNGHRFMGCGDWLCNSFGIFFGGTTTAKHIDSCPRFRKEIAEVIVRHLNQKGGA